MKTSYLAAAAVISGMVFGAFFSWGASILAEGTEIDSGIRVFPYNGVLDFNGVPFDGTIDVEMTVLDENDNTFTETHNNIPVSTGRFNVQVGSGGGVGVPAWVFQTDSEISLRLAVRNGDSDGDFVQLGGTQPIEPVPFAYWTAEGNAKEVKGDFYTSGALLVRGETRVDALTLGDSVPNVDLGGRLEVFQGSGAGLNFPNGTKVQYKSSRLYTDVGNGNNDNLSLKIGGSTVLDIFKHAVTSNVDIEITGDLVVNGSFSINGSTEGRLFHGDALERYTKNNAGVVTIGDSERRFCGLSSHADEIDTNCACEILDNNGTYELHVTNEADGCRCWVHCITW